MILPIVGAVRPRPALAAVTVLVTTVAALTGISAVSARHDAYGDVPEDAYYHIPVMGLAASGVFDGTDCAEGLFCPHESVDRATAAVWIIRSLDAVPADSDPVEFRYTGRLAGTHPGSHTFIDVDPERWAASYIYALARWGVTVGCGRDPARFCPDDAVSRGQMASFLKRALDLPEADPAGFEDVNEDNAHIDSIDRLFATGITVGCSSEPLRFCPDDAVSRGQMATFLHRGLEWHEQNTSQEDSADPTGQTGAGLGDVGLGDVGPPTPPPPRPPPRPFPTPSFPTPSFPTPSFPTPSFPTPSFPTPSFPTPSFPTPSFPTPRSRPPRSRPPRSRPPRSRPPRSRPPRSRPPRSRPPRSRPPRSRPPRSRPPRSRPPRSRPPRSRPPR